MERLSLHVQDSLRGNAPLIATPVLQTKYRSPNTTEAVLRALEFRWYGLFSHLGGREKISFHFCWICEYVDVKHLASPFFSG